MKPWLALCCLAFKIVGLALVVTTEQRVLGWILFFSGGVYVVIQMLLPRSQAICDTVFAFEPDGRELWLTIDDGPHIVNTPKTLDLLDQHQAKATFFTIGKKAEEHPELIREIVRRGHSLGNHTYNHPTACFWLYGPKRTRREIERTQCALAQAGSKAQLFRPPVGIKNLFLRRILRETQLRCVAWTIRSGDGNEARKEAIVKRVLRETRPGAIVLMHEGGGISSEKRIETLREILRAWSEQGYRCKLPDPATFRLYKSGNDHLPHQKTKRSRVVRP